MLGQVNRKRRMQRIGSRGIEPEAIAFHDELDLVSDFARYEPLLSFDGLLHADPRALQTIVFVLLKAFPLRDRRNVQDQKHKWRPFVGPVERFRPFTEFVVAERDHQFVAFKLVNARSSRLARCAKPAIPVSKREVDLLRVSGWIETKELHFSEKHAKRKPAV